MKEFPVAAARAGLAGHEDHLSWGSRRQPVELSPTAALASSGGKENVLVVDDTPLMRGALANTLRQAGYQVWEAADAVEAQYLAEAQQNIHLVVVDLPTSEIGYLELAQWFRAIHPETRVLLTADSFWELDLELRDMPRVTVLPKPFTPLELTRMVRLTLA